NNNLVGFDDNQWLAGGGLAYKMGKNTLKGQVYYAGEQDKTDDTEALQFALGWDRNLSKATAAYVAFSGIQPGSNAANARGVTYKLGGPGHGFNLPVVSDEFEWGISAGYRIKF
ncbi:MAG: hypothetical protein U9R74_08595, partial [Pseudomonadota bacterium]|nr:hypothetical protein [Pseudomonadota bacterium]